MKNSSSRANSDERFAPAALPLTIPADLPREHVAAFFDSLPVGVGVALDPECRHIRANAILARWLGLTPQENISKSAPEAERPAYRVLRQGLELTADDLPLQMSARQARSISDLEIEVIPPHGPRVCLSAYAAPLFDSNGAVWGSIGVFVDITEDRQNEARQRLLAEAGRALTSSLDYETTLQTVARLAVPELADACTVYALDESKELYQIATAYVDPHQNGPPGEPNRQCPPGVQDMVSLVSRAIRSGQAILETDVPETRVEGLGTDAETQELMRPTRLRSTMVVPLVARGQVLGALSFLITASDRRYSEKDLRLAEELARQAAEAIDHARLYRQAQETARDRDEFLSIAAHELRTPIAVMKGYIDLLQRHTIHAPVDEQRDRALQAISNQGERLQRLINLLLDVARLETGELSMDLHALDLARLAEQVLEELQPGLKQHTLRLVRPEEPVIVHGDELRLHQVLQNLIQNAIRYSPAGGEITLELERERLDARLVVRDPGIGIHAEALPHIFRRFYRAENAIRSGATGMGVGLYVVKEIVARHGGTIAVDSLVGQGSTFTLRLPLSRRALEG